MRILGLVMLAFLLVPGVVGAVGQNTTRVQNRLETQAEGAIRQLRQEERLEIRNRYQENLQKIKDEAKKRVVERIRNRMCAINENRTEVMIRQLDRMGEILGKAETRANAVAEKGKDISTVTAAIKTAREKIATARAAVVAQADMECVIDISGSTTALGGEVRGAISGLEKTLQGINEQVRTARRAVSDAIVALAHVMGNPLPIPTPSGS